MANVGLDVSYFISTRFSVEASALLGIANAKGTFTEKQPDPFDRFVLFDIGIGANWYLPGKAKRLWAK